MPLFEKGNKFWCLAEDPGVKPFYDSPEKFGEAVQDYFVNGVNKKTVIVGKGDDKRELEIPVPTITGLCYHLGFASRQSFYDYEQKTDFAYIVKRARLLLEMFNEENLQHGNVTGAIFALKQYGWKDQQDVNVTGMESFIEKLHKANKRVDDAGCE